MRIDKKTRSLYGPWGAIAVALFLTILPALPAVAAPTIMERAYLEPQMSWPYEPQKQASKEGKFYLNGQNEGYVTVFDAKTLKKLKVINMWAYEKELLKKQGKKIDDKTDDFIKKNMRPHHSWIVPGGRFNYISNNAKKSDRFWVVDTYTDTVVAHLNTGAMGPLHGAFSPFRPIAAFGNVQDKEKGLVTFFDTEKHTVTGSVKTSGTRTRDVVFTPDGKHIYVTNQGWEPKKKNFGGVDMIDIDAKKIVKTFDIPGSKGMKITNDGNLVAVASFKKGFVVFIDTRKHEIIGKVEVGGRPNNISFHPDGSKAYVGVYDKNEFVVIDIKNMKVKTRIPGGKEANAVYIAPGNSGIAIGTNEKDDFVTIIDINKDVKIKDIDTPLGSHNVAFTPDGKKAIISCKRSREAVILDVDTLEEIMVIPKAGHGNNGVRWVPYGPGRSSAKPYG